MTLYHIPKVVWVFDVNIPMLCVHINLVFFIPDVIDQSDKGRIVSEHLSFMFISHYCQTNQLHTFLTLSPTLVIWWSEWTMGLVFFINYGHFHRIGWFGFEQEPRVWTITNWHLSVAFFWSYDFFLSVEVCQQLCQLSVCWKKSTEK